jgi:hypothetical protein
VWVRTLQPCLALSNKRRTSLPRNCSLSATWMLTISTTASRQVATCSGSQQAVAGALIGASRSLSSTRRYRTRQANANVDDASSFLRLVYLFFDFSLATSQPSSSFDLSRSFLSLSLRLLLSPVRCRPQLLLAPPQIRLPELLLRLQVGRATSSLYETAKAACLYTIRAVDTQSFRVCKGCELRYILSDDGSNA